MIFHRYRNGVWQFSQPAATDFVVGVNDGLTVVMRGVEQPFRGLVMLHITMIIKMIAAQISEYRCSKLMRRHAVLYQSVRRDFHRGEGRPLPCQTGKHVLHVYRR